MNKLFILVPTTAQVQQINEKLGDDGHIYSALHVIKESTVSQEYFKILLHSQILPNIQAGKLLKQLLFSLCLKANAEMVPKTPSCYCMLLM